MTETKRELPSIPPFFERHPLFTLILTYVIIAATALMMRRVWFGLIIPGIEPYFHINVANLILWNGLEQSFFGEPLFITPFQIIVANFSYFWSALTVARVLPVICGFLSIFQLWFILSKLRVVRRLKFFMILAFILSPVFIKMSFVFSPYALNILILLFAINLMLKKKQHYLGLLLILIFALNGVVEALLSIFILFALSKYTYSKFYSFGAILTLFAFILRTFGFVSDFGYPIWPSPLAQPLLERSFTVLGAPWGIGFFLLITGIGGIIISWKKKNRLWMIYSATFLLIIMSVIGITSANVYLTLLLAIFSGVLIERFFADKWDLEFLKQLTLGFIICGFLFSATVQVAELFEQGPSAEVVDSLVYLSDYCSPGDIVLTDHSRGFWVQHYAKCTPFTNDYVLFSSDAKQRLNITNFVFQSRNLNQVKAVFDEYEIKYVFVDEFMKNSLWNSKQDGLLYLFRNNETFKKVYSTSKVDIWEII